MLKTGEVAAKACTGKTYEHPTSHTQHPKRETRNRCAASSRWRSKDSILSMRTSPRLEVRRLEASRLVEVVKLVAVVRFVRVAVTSLVVLAGHTVY